jgi:hypothetical protein
VWRRRGRGASWQRVPQLGIASRRELASALAKPSWAHSYDPPISPKYGALLRTSCIHQEWGDDFKGIWDARVGDRQIGHAHFWDRALSRRQLLGRTAGLAGLAVGSSFGLPVVANASTLESGGPRPIPGGTVIDGLGLFHFYFPTANNPVGSTDTIESGHGDPSTITDFNGFIGVGDWGPGTGKDGHGTTLYWAADLRFMDGEFVDLDGHRDVGAFAFVWLDIFSDVGLTSQVHDFNPGIEESGLFWTVRLDRGAVRVNLHEGTAALHVDDLDIEDYGNVVNALQDGPSVEATVSFDVNWSGGHEPLKISNHDLRFRGQYVRNSATLVWSAAEPGFSFQSDPLASGFAEIGHERNGVFF